MFNKKKKEAKRLAEQERIAKYEAERLEQEKFDKFFEGKDLSDLFDEVKETMTLIEKAVTDDDHVLTNEYTGRARNLQIKIGRAVIRFYHIGLGSTWTDEADTNTYPKWKKGEDVCVTIYRCIIGRYTDRSGNSYDMQSFKEAYYQFKVYEEGFPESLKVLIKLQ